MDAPAPLVAALAARYVIDREIGRGGMATVYLARDVRHKRRVAVKVLNPELGAVLGVERFLAEIQVTANLQHPNLLPLFDSGEADGLLFYVMPYVEGESLRAALQREKQLPIDEALHVSTAIAGALDYAHRHGVIHRDLKPENILMQDGEPLVADFGIALAVSNAGGDRITQTGLSLGTPQYMSPEQATGDRELDGRTDVYSLGAVTYEMLVGEPPHDGKTSQAIIAKVLTDRPRSIRLARDTVPPHVEAAVDRALAKIPADRFHTAHQFADALAGRGAAVHSIVPDSATARASRGLGSRGRLWGALPWAVAAAALVTAAVIARTRSAGGDARVIRYEIPMTGSMAFGVAGGNRVAISPDGRTVAFVSRTPSGIRHLFLRAADELQTRDVSGTENSGYPFFSPDGQWIAFFAGGRLVKTAVAGGRTEVITELAATRGATWTPSGWIVASTGTVLAKTPASGGVLQPFTRLDSAHGETGQFFPVALGDGKTILYTSNTMGGAANTRIGVASLTDGSSVVLDLQGSYPLGVIDDYLVYTTSAGTVMAAPFDAGKRRITGPATPLFDQTAVDGSTGVSFVQMSMDGSLVYVSGVSRRQLSLIGGNGVPTAIGEPGSFTWPRFSPDGKRIAVSVGPLSQRDVWVYRLPSGPFTRLTTQGPINDRPEWTPDGKSIVFRSNRGGRNALWIQSADDGTPAQPFFARPDAQIDEGVLSPDGAFLLAQRDSTGNGEIWYRGMRGDTTFRRIALGNGGGIGIGSGAYGGRFSPDGKWVVYTSAESSIEEVYVRSFPSLTNQFQVSSGGGGTAVWSADGKRIYYVNGGQLVAASIGSTHPFAIASREVVLGRGYTFSAVHADYDVAPDGRTILALQLPTEDPQLIVVRNFGADVRARTRGAPR